MITFGSGVSRLTVVNNRIIIGHTNGDVRFCNEAALVCLLMHARFCMCAFVSVPMCMFASGACFFLASLVRFITHKLPLKGVKGVREHKRCKAHIK